MARDREVERVSKRPKKANGVTGGRVLIKGDASTASIEKAGATQLTLVRGPKNRLVFKNYIIENR